MDRSGRRGRQTGALRERVSRLSEASLRVNESLDSGDLERLSVAGPRRPGVLPALERPAGTAAGGQAGGVHRVHRTGQVPPLVSLTAFMAALILHQGLRVGSFPAGLASRKYEVKRRCRAVLNQEPSYSYVIPGLIHALRQMHIPPWLWFSRGLGLPGMKDWALTSPVPRKQPRCGPPASPARPSPGGWVC